MIPTLLIFAAILQALAVAYGLVLLYRRNGAASAWLSLLGAMMSMLAWRVVVAMEIEAPVYFNPLIAIWGSTCMFGAMFLFGREVGRRQHIEQERDHLLTSERAARRDAERANQFKDEFLANLSHELRTPLAVILGWCTILRKSKGQAELDSALAIIERNARIQTRLVDDMLDMTRIRAGTLRLDMAALPLEQPVRAALQDVQPQAEARKLSLYLECAQAPVVYGDAARLQQLVSNLLINAVKFTPAGGSITVSIRELDGRAQLTVRDTGEGIEPDFLPHLFERFRQQDSSYQRKHGGLGLGLSIVADLVRMHGGEVAAHSDGTGKGASFTVTLPLPDAAGAGAVDSSNVNAAASDKTLPGLRIVVIDDEEDVRAAVARILEQMGAEVIALESGAEIEQILQDKHPDLLVIDIGMPGEDGYTLLRRIRQLVASRGGDTPAISLTAFAREEDRARAMASGFQDHLTKPVEMQRLSSAILSAVKASRSNLAVV